MSHRIDQINSLLREQVADILLTRLNRDQFKLVTVTYVETSPDLSSAKVFVSIPGGEFKDFSQWIKGYMYNIQGELNKRLSLHKAPRITFKEDTTGAYVDKIETLLKSIKK